MKLVNEGGLRITGTKWNHNYDAEIIARFDLRARSSKFQCIKRCHWYPPEKGFVMFCCDGSSFGNPGSAGFGVVVRDPDCQVIATLVGGIGIASNYLAETYGMCAMELAVEWNMQNIIIVSDSKTVISEFVEGNFPWFIKGRWLKAMKRFNQIKFLHYNREVNFSADNVAKKGASLASGNKLVHIGRPQFLLIVEMPDVIYYRFC
ncbi:uncharacterized protein LOC113295373 [Papaver somniferum]|uniref:uncharacterized protein LOC113295373 n=1 Tax=Papaver somniferum TaxID=3469 RepID=UPI000E701076|nr:uncharacterized protein LOC113295373 [Papaver somniferum]